MHVSDVSHIIFPSRVRANSFLPIMNKLQYSRHHWSGEGRRSFWEAADKIVEEFFRGYLQMEWIPAGVYQCVEERESEHCDVWVAVVHKPGDGHGRLPWSVNAST